MQITVLQDNEPVGVLYSDSIVSISRYDDIKSERYTFTLTVKYSEHNWIIFRNSESYSINHHPNLYIQIDDVKVRDDKIIILGHVEMHELITTSQEKHTL